MFHINFKFIFNLGVVRNDFLEGIKTLSRAFAI